MPFHTHVARALAAKDIIAKEDVDAVAELLKGPLEQMAAADAAEKAALADQAKLASEVLAAKKKLEADESVGDLGDAIEQTHTLEADEQRRLDNEAAIEGAQQTISDAYDEATEVMMAAGHINAGQAGALASTISDVWAKGRRSR